MKHTENSSIVVQWDEVDDSLLTTYVVTWANERYHNIQVIILEEQSSCTITGLTLDTVYTITVSASNSCGNGPEYSTSVLLTSSTSTITAITNTIATTSGASSSTSTAITITASTTSTSPTTTSSITDLKTSITNPNAVITSTYTATDIMSPVSTMNPNDKSKDLKILDTFVLDLRSRCTCVHLRFLFLC